MNNLYNSLAEVYAAMYKTFINYEEARKYVRRKITTLVGTYTDDITWLGFSIKT